MSQAPLLAELLVALAPVVAKAEYPEAVPKMMSAARAIKDPKLRATSTVLIAERARLPHSDFVLNVRSALATIATIRDPIDRLECLVSIADELNFNDKTLLPVIDEQTILTVHAVLEASHAGDSLRVPDMMTCVRASSVERR